ncbi:NAD(P)H-binding protein [Micromonospora sp. NPDC049559]|uniref:NAD(P)H-binding protein n=1 Tax=Micromonospora sp. NPDC049559 TaxID=3155923 RepID=UPI003435FAD8
MTILVTGATGSVGRQVVGQLVAAGEEVRALSRSPETAGLPAGVPVFQGDLERPETLAAAFEGVDRLYLFPVPRTAHDVVAMARKAGVRRIVVLSSDSMNTRLETNRESVEDHGAVERAVAEADVEWTFLRPFAFAGNALFWAHSIRTENVVRAAYPLAAQALVHEADIAAVATTALLEDGHDGAAYRLTGPESLTQIEQVRILGEAIGREIRFEELTHEQKLAELTQFIPAGDAEMILGYFAVAVHTPDVVLPTVEEVTGRPARSFAQWAADHRSDFR